MTSPTGATIAFAHRGARSERPENTLDAFTRALELGANGLESDAWLTADGVVVLDHDGVIGPVWRRRAMAACSRAELPDHVPSLTQLYETCGTAYELSLDVKDPAALSGIVAVASSFGAADRLWLCHNDWRPMAAWRRAAPHCHLVESTNLHWMSEGLSARVSALAAAGFAAINLHRSQWDEGALRETHAVGLRAFGWDAQSEEELVRLVELGLDGVYSDHVDRMTRAVGLAPGGARQT
jgi:glycerophosphoryl diester phosphodiesterase